MHRPSRRPSSRTQPLEVVDGRWLLKAVAIVVGGALLCTYVTLCLLFYVGQWQLVLHPVRTTGPTPEGLIRFSSEATGQPQLAGEWLPAISSNRYNQLTILFLPGGDSTTAAFSSTQTALREIGLNVFTFDYRGYGRSANAHPSEKRMQQDSRAAWTYLISTRHIPENRIIPYGVGVGASLAASLAAEHGEVPAIILDSPYTDLGRVIGGDSRFRFLPFSLLFHEDFPLRDTLSKLQRPKMLIVREDVGEPEAFRTAASPKSLLNLAASSGSRFSDGVSGFLNEAVPVPPVTPASK
jgi:pimeloyl-ACP methyl ester carboxylesterase